MAMALSSTIAPTALGSQRRRRVSTGPTINANNANANTTSTSRSRRESVGATNTYTNTNANDTHVNEATTEIASRRLSVRFAQFDATLQDSDQTMTSSAWRRRSVTPFVGSSGGLMAPPRARSSFFPDSTDDEEIGWRDGIATLARRSDGTSRVPTPTITRPPPAVPVPASVSVSALTPTFPVIHIGDVQFPTTRTVLWDRRVLAGPFALQTADVVPRVRLVNRVLKQLHALVMDKTHTSSSRLLGYLTEDEASEEEEEKEEERSPILTLSTLVPHKPAGERSCRCWVPIYRSKASHQEDEVAEREHMETTARASYASTSSVSTRRYSGRQDSAMIPIEARGVVAMSMERSRAEIDVEIELVVPVVQLQFRLIRSLPLLLTPLAASLLRCEFGSEARRFGYLTLDRARKAVPLLETDPLVLQRPIVGLWVYGVDVDDPASAESMRVQDPYLFESCVRFLSSKIIKERAQVDVDTFLVAIYPGSAMGPLPRFFECHASRFDNSPSPVEWASASARGRCLAGVSSYKNDLALRPVLSLEGPTQSALGLEVTVPHDRFVDVDTRTVTAEQRERAAQLAVDRVTTTSECLRDQTLQDQPQESQSMRSCCRSQHILASQHQHMLEQQQRQLQDLQEQIAQLQRVLTDTRAENARLLAASSSRSSGSSNVGDDDHQQRVRQNFDVGDEVLDSSFVTRPHTVNDAQESTEHAKELGNDSSMVSSLVLSSISDDSNPSELSSVSSSLVGPRLKSLLTTEREDGEPAHAVETAVSDVGMKQAGSPREPQTVAEAAQLERPPLQAEGEAGDSAGAVADTATDDEGAIRRLCPYVPLARRSRNRSHKQCERDEFEEDSDASKIDELLAERLRIPNTPNREEIVRGGTLTTFGFSHGSSFSIPKIKYVAEIVTCDSDDDDEEEIRRIELKYRKHRTQ